MIKTNKQTNTTRDEKCAFIITFKTHLTVFLIITVKESFESSFFFEFGRYIQHLWLEPSH